MHARRYIPMTALLVMLSGCGAAATLPQNPESANLAGRSNDAIWHSEFGDPATLDVSVGNMVTEDGVLRLNVISVAPPSDGSTYIQGVYQVDVPDADRVLLTTLVGFPNQVEDAAGLFRIYVQDGVEFPILSEATVISDGRLNTLTADLSAYRGQSRLLILSVASLNGEPLSSPSLWVDPTFLTP